MQMKREEGSEEVVDSQAKKNTRVSLHMKISHFSVLIAHQPHDKTR